MKTTLLEKLLVFYEEDPRDPFNLYALALEYQKHDASVASEHFERLLSDFPDYLPTYYHAAQFFILIGEIDKARIIFEKGIQIAAEQKNTKAQQELLRAYRAFEDDQLDE
ncbi:tetratricopeptide repeat protein [Salmonirosea aquatica]|uniref:Tetratricopeptide repeat protein n=1 Tax=Salmonirosea aquatica TaxID=2654236 RepID=A0A7C9BE32_9BACT|nr:tetratricopeptide repeat protein [Cytophagaceae bacterium SJW1-29]